MRERRVNDSVSDYSPLQLFVLMHLAAADLRHLKDIERQTKGAIWHHSFSEPDSRRISITIQELTSVIPPNVFPTPNSIKQIWKELYRLHRKDLLEWHGTWR